MPGIGLSFMKALMRVLRKTHLLNTFLQLQSFGFYMLFRIRNNIKAVDTQYLPSKNRPRYILVGNHASAADAYLAMSIMTGRYMRRIYAVAHEKSFRKDTMEKLMLEAYGMIPRVGSGKTIIRKMALKLMENNIIAIVPEGMTSSKVMKGYTGVMRLYWMVNQQYETPQIPLVPLVSIGANTAYPISVGKDGKYHAQKTGIVGKFGKPIYFPVPKNPPKAWFREKTDELMDQVAYLAGQTEGAIESWKQDALARDKVRNYKV